MESSDQNENVILIDGENEICFNQWNMQDEILNVNFYTKKYNKRNNINKWNKWKQTFKNCMFKKKYGEVIIAM